MPPTIPTSFAPRDTGTRAPASSFVGVFGFFAYAFFGIVVAAAIGLFFYNRVLDGVYATREAALRKEEQGIDTPTIEQFVRLRNRLDSSALLLKDHVAFSNFFASFTPLLPVNIRFNSLHIAVSQDGTGARVDGSGVARNFNALSAASGAFATEGRIKDVIFSNIIINRDSSVSFTFAANVDQKLLAFGQGSSSAVSTTTTP